MLIRSKATFFLDDQDFHYKKPDTSKQKTRNSSLISNEALSNSVGLGILINNCSTEPNNTILVVKHPIKLSFVASIYSQEPSFLKACCLCRKKLSPEKNVYMYMGDQGFCSEACRSRQIVKDEIREIEISTKKILSSSSPYCPKNVRIRLPSHRNRIPVAA